MEIGLLWYDNDPKVALEEKVRRAAGRYAEKFGQRATLCVLNPATLGSAAGEVAVEGGVVKLAASRSVLPHHFWIGVAQSA